MSCSVSIPSSPLFSPSSVSSPLSCKSSISSPETLAEIASSSSSFPFTNQIQRSSTELRSCRIDVSSTSSYCAVASTSSLSSFKRKKPARLCIPNPSLSFSASAIPSVDKRDDLLEEERNGFAVCCKRGKRAVMEDRYSAVGDIQGDPKQAFFGIFDGHGGTEAAEFAASNIHTNILDEIHRSDDDYIEKAIKHGYLNTDSNFLKEHFKSGSCCVTALIRKGNLIVSNAGDCRAVLSRGGIAEALTSDHRPTREDERARIQQLGGFVDIYHGSWRINGTLAVSRGIGDQHLKNWVIAEPETKIIRIKPELDFLILASDGLWDKVSNQEAIDVVHPLCVDIDNPQALLACKKLVDLSIFRGSLDDISVMLIHLGRYI